MFETYTAITGRVISEPRRFMTANGEAISLRVACNTRRRDDETNEWKTTSTLFLTVKCWRKLAVAVADRVAMGSVIIAFGTLHTDEYVGNDGLKHSNLEMSALSLGLDLGYNPGEQTGGTEPPVDRMPAVEDPNGFGVLSGDAA
ncbi:MAG: single-stranded DNA-binding protein [Gordonia sp. (in: high G+C Gram-positive bacteria)]